MEKPLTGYSEDNYYTTTDTAEAAWLYSQGYELLDVIVRNFRKTGEPSVFVFLNNSPDIKRTAFLFQCGKAEGDILTFFRAYKRMLAKAQGR